jgi:pimeloyl-ACP methyl ester carboxylesterase
VEPHGRRLLGEFMGIVRVTSRRYKGAALLACAVALLGVAAPRGLAQPDHGAGATQSNRFKPAYVRLGNADEGLLFESSRTGPQGRIAVMYSHPSGNNFNSPIGPELASRGYRVLLVNHHGGREDMEDFLPGLSRGIQHLRKLPGVDRAVYIGHSGGGMLAAFYANVAANGRSACQGPEKIYPCKGAGLDGLAKPDGVVLLDANLGAPYRTQSIDPAVADGRKRIPALDMFSVANGFDHAAKRATYSPAFAKRFYAAQKARSDKLIASALDRLRAIEQGNSPYSDNEPLVIRGAKMSQPAAALHHPDPEHYLARTKKPRLLLKADGTKPEVIVPSVRPPNTRYATEFASLDAWTLNTTVRQFLSQVATRTTADYAITADDIVGVDWRSGMLSTAGNAEGISVPSLVMVMTCNDHVVHGEIIFDHLASKDKTFAAVEGALHGFTPCKPEYGNTQKRMFDFIDGWLTKAGRL